MTALAKWEYEGYHIEVGHLRADVSTWGGAGAQAPLVFRIFSSPLGRPMSTVLLILGDRVEVKRALTEGKKKVASLIDESAPLNDLYCYECVRGEKPDVSIVLDEFDCKGDIRRLLGLTGS